MNQVVCQIVKSIKWANRAHEKSNKACKTLSGRRCEESNRTLLVSDPFNIWASRLAPGHVDAEFGESVIQLSSVLILGILLPLLYCMPQLKQQSSLVFIRLLPGCEKRWMKKVAVQLEVLVNFTPLGEITISHPNEERGFDLAPLLMQENTAAGRHGVRTRLVETLANSDKA